MAKDERIINSEESLSKFIGFIRAHWREKKFLRVSVDSSKNRTTLQNGRLYAWYNQISAERGEMTPDGVRNYCKLHCGVPILRAEDEEFMNVYDSCIKQLTYEQKVDAMHLIDVSSRMSTKQFNRYTDTIQEHFAAHDVDPVILEY